MITSYANYRLSLLDDFARIGLRDGAQLVDVLPRSDSATAVFVPIRGINTLRYVCCGPAGTYPGGPYETFDEYCWQMGPLATGCKRPSGHKGLHVGEHPKHGVLKW